MAEKGGVTIPTFYSVNNGHESITSYTKEFDNDLYQTLPNLYIICIADNQGEKRTIPAGLFVKTSYTHKDVGFIDAVTGIATSSTELSPFIHTNSSLFPARLTLNGSAPLNEQEMLRIAFQQSLKFSEGGNT